MFRILLLFVVISYITNKFGAKHESNTKNSQRKKTFGDMVLDDLEVKDELKKFKKMVVSEFDLNNDNDKKITVNTRSNKDVTKKLYKTPRTMEGVGREKRAFRPNRIGNRLNEEIKPMVSNSIKSNIRVKGKRDKIYDRDITLLNDNLEFEAEDIIKGIIFSEILGKPKSLTK